MNGGCVSGFQKRKDGVFYRGVWDRNRRRKSVASLGTHDRDEAERFGRELLAELLRGVQPTHSGPISLGTLWSEFSTKSAQFRDNKPRTRADTTKRAEILIAFFGPARDVRGLTADDQREYANARRV